jgi:ATP-dependent DNA ligase
MVVQDESGRADFHAMRAALSREPERLAFFAFDLPMLDGHDLRNKPLHERRRILAVGATATLGLPLHASCTLDRVNCLPLCRARAL